jgi:hypothetical protein
MDPKNRAWGADLDYDTATRKGFLGWRLEMTAA